MKNTVLITLALIFSSLLSAQNDVTLRLGSTDASTLSPGDDVLIPVIIDYVTPGSYLPGLNVDFMFDTAVINWNGSSSSPNQGFSFVHPGLTPITPFGNWMFFEADDGLIITWIDPIYVGFPISSGETLFELIFTYNGGETPLSWGIEETSLGIFNYTFINGCVCSPVPNPVIFHVTSGGGNLENAEVVIETDLVPTNVSGNSVFYLLDGEYDYTVSKTGYETQTGSVTISAMQTIEIDLELETFPVTFTCDVSCENEFNGWNVIISEDTLLPGQTIDLPAGDWIYSIAWLDCLPVQGTISVTAPVNIDCGFIGNPEPHVVFHVSSSQAGNIEGAIIDIDSYSLTTNLQGEAGFCLPDGEHTYTISKEGYAILGDVFSYVNSCQDTTLNILLNLVGIGGFQHKQFMISPNPGNGKFLINNIPDGSLPVEIRVFDLTGKKVYMDLHKNPEEIFIDLSNHQKGIYFIQLQAGQMIWNDKLILQ